MIRVVILLPPPCHLSLFPFHLINKDTISWASCHLPTSTHLRLSPRIQRALWLGLFPCPAPVVRLGNSHIHDDSLTSIPYSPKLSLPVTFYLFYGSNFLLWPCSITTPNHASSEILNLQPRNPVFGSGSLFHATVPACSSNSLTAFMCSVSHHILTSFLIKSGACGQSLQGCELRSQLFLSLPVFNSG